MIDQRDVRVGCRSPQAKLLHLSRPLRMTWLKRSQVSFPCSLYSWYDNLMNYEKRDMVYITSFVCIIHQTIKLIHDDLADILHKNPTNMLCSSTQILSKKLPLLWCLSRKESSVTNATIGPTYDVV